MNAILENAGSILLVASSVNTAVAHGYPGRALLMAVAISCAINREASAFG
jgi:hypothetical protein